MVGPGAVLITYLKKKGIRTTAGCDCTRLAKDMNFAGAEKVLLELEIWTNKMVESIKSWKKLTDNKWAPFICPPKMIVQRTIRWACEESIRLNQKELING